MKSFRYIKSTVLVLLCAVALTTSSICVEKVTAQTAASPVAVQNTLPENTVKPLLIVANPTKYLNKTVTMVGKFDKFTTLGLDYKSAFRSSEEYITFLIKRDNTTYDIPLSEMKLFMKRDVAEKYIDLKSNDEISIVGTVFSDALGDSWIDVKELNIIKKAPEKDGVK